MNIYELTGNYEHLLNMLYDEDVDEKALLDTLESIEGDIEDKADGYAKIIKELETQSNARKEEAKRLTQSAKTIDNRIKMLKSNLFNCMKITGKTKFTTNLFSFSIAKNGGKQALTIDGDVQKNIKNKTWGCRINTKDKSKSKQIIKYFKNTRREQIKAWRKEWKLTTEDFINVLVIYLNGRRDINKRIYKALKKNYIKEVISNGYTSINHR
jgi:hypothetical protein